LEWRETLGGKIGNPTNIEAKPESGNANKPSWSPQLHISKHIIVPF